MMTKPQKCFRQLIHTLDAVYIEVWVTSGETRRSAAERIAQHKVKKKYHFSESARPVLLSPLASLDTPFGLTIKLYVPPSSQTEPSRVPWSLCPGAVP
jgi:hypothetical protein